MHGLPCFDLLAASIRKSGLEIKNRCTDCPCFGLLAASIRKSGPEIENRCTDCPCFDLLAASIRKSGPEIENRCITIVPASRTARLQRSRGVQAGTGASPAAFNLGLCRLRGILSLPSATTTFRRRNHSPLPLRKLESVAEHRCSSGVVAVCRRNYSS